MELKLIRKEFSDKTTIGELFVEDKFFSYVLEDVDRGLKQDMTLEDIKLKKVYAETAIPYGRYQVVITFSNKFQRPLPLLMYVPGYSGIRIHPGNNQFHTAGCLLPGKKKAKDRISESTLAFNELYVMIESALKREKVWITIEKSTENVVYA